jgi:uncharacterized protein (DUF362 family)
LIKLGSEVAIVKGDRKNIIAEALELIDLRSRVKSNYRVLIKPNLVRVPSNSPYVKVKGAYEPTIAPEGDIVHRDAIEHLLESLTHMGVKDITIGEGAGGCETSVNYKALAIYELAEEFGSKVIDLNYADSIKVELSDGLALDYAWIPKIVVDSDFTINLAALKIHGGTAVTLCLKNWGMGLPPGRYYGWNKAAYEGATNYHGKLGSDKPLPIHGAVQAEFKYGQELAVSKVLVDFCTACPPHLNIIDGFTVMDYERLGYRKVRVREANLIFASYDIVAVDTVATRSMCFDPKKIVHIEMAGEKRLGTANLSKINVLGQKVEDIQLNCNPRGTQREVML